MTADEYPTVRLRRTQDGYTTHDGAYRVVRAKYASIAYCGCYRRCFHVYRGDARIAWAADTLREARTAIACDIENRRTT